LKQNDKAKHGAHEQVVTRAATHDFADVIESRVIDACDRSCMLTLLFGEALYC
jgi:hypothetical protein